MVIRWTLDESEGLAVDDILHPYAIVLTPDCDLDWDYKTRFDSDGNANEHEKFNGKEVPTILLCEMATAKGLKERGEIYSKAWTLIKKK